MSRTSYDVIQDAKKRLYGEGLADGMEGTLRLLLGEPWSGGEPCPGPVPENVERWARDALALLQMAKSA